MTKLILWSSALKDEYTSLFKSCEIHTDKLPIIDAIIEKLDRFHKRYEAIAHQVGCPWWFVGLVHYIECGFRFDRHLHNGDPLSARTVRVPSGRPIVGRPPFTFEQSAMDALRFKHFNEVKDWSIAKALFFLEGYNGFGYRQFHPQVLSPYLWSFTNHYTKGKYVSDSHFDPDCVSEQAGLAAILKRAVDRKVVLV
ncbi:MAG: hypothetical protein KGL39_31505 [Patescibacteria group bacterium]|nr:hypothetical protein [Patescibacteria group bacterium]